MLKSSEAKWKKLNDMGGVECIFEASIMNCIECSKFGHGMKERGKV